jgi:hypothetical protein
VIFQVVYLGDFSGPEALNYRQIMHMGMMDRGFTVVAKELVLWLVYMIHKLPLLVNVYVHQLMHLFSLRKH